MQVLLLIAALTYCGLPWEAAAGFPLDPARSYLSELAAADQPSGVMFRALDITTGVLILAALALARGLTGVGALVKAAGIGLAAFAFLTIVDASSPMACATSASRRCAQADAANTLGLAHQIHTVSSVGALAALLVSALLLLVAVVRAGRRLRQSERWLVVVLVGLLTTVTVFVSVLAMMSTGDGTLVTGGGFVQRAQVVLVSVYIGGFGFIAWRLHDGAPFERRTDAMGRAR